MNLRNCDFVIKNNNKVEIFNLSKEILLEKVVDRWLPESKWDNYAWVDTSEIKKAKNVEDLLRAFRWNPEIDENEDIVDLYFTGEKLGDDEFLFNVIASGVESGSYIEMQGEDGTIWRWCFNDGKCEEKLAKIVFE